MNFWKSSKGGGGGGGGSFSIQFILQILDLCKGLTFRGGKCNIIFRKWEPFGICQRHPSLRWMSGDDLDTRSIYQTIVWKKKQKKLKLFQWRTLVWWTSMFSITQNIAHLIKCASQINIHAYLHLIQPITYNKSINENCPIKIIKSNLVRCLSFFFGFLIQQSYCMHVIHD